MATPIRTCVCCGSRKEKRDLVRYTWQGEQPQADPEGHSPGRGAYCCGSDVCRQRFLKQKKKWKRLFRL